MDYFKTYEALCATAFVRTLPLGAEIHHVTPRCLGGSDDPDNLVPLTAREHYVAHWLLIKMYPESWRLKHAFGMMSVRNTTSTRTVTSRQYARMMEARSQAMKTSNPMDRVEVRNKVSATRKARFAEGSLLPRYPSEDERARARVRMKGEQNPMKGKPEKNPTAAPHIVVFRDGTTKTYLYGKLGYEEIGVSRSAWIRAVIKQLPIPKYGIERIIKE